MRKLLTVAVGALVVVVGLGGLLLAFSARDDAGLGGDVEADVQAGPGELQTDGGARHGRSAPPIRPDDLPASGEHQPATAERDRAELSGDEWLHALELGNVILAYDGARPPAPLARLQENLAGPYDSELAAAGQSVILARLPGLAVPTAVAWRRLLALPASSNEAAQEFVDAHLGTGAPG